MSSVALDARIKWLAQLRIAFFFSDTEGRLAEIDEPGGFVTSSKQATPHIKDGPTGCYYSGFGPRRT
jgi:hypothetical protein